MNRDYQTRKICPICGKEFRVEYPNQRYCSKECQDVGYHHARSARGRTKYQSARLKRQLELAGRLVGLTDYEEIVKLLDEYCIMRRV